MTTPPVTKTTASGSTNAVPRHTPEAFRPMGAQTLLTAADARADALHGGAEVVGGDGEGGELVGGYTLREVSEVYGAAHAR